MYVASDPYFDFSDDEGCWTSVFPSTRGFNDTPGWERTAEGVDDYRYLLTCERLIARARKAGKAKAEADAAKAYVAKTLEPVTLAKKSSAQLAPADYDAFKRTLAGHIIALRKALAR